MWSSLFQSLLWCQRTQENHHLRTEEINCWKTEEIWLKLVRNCCFISWKSSGVVVLCNDRFERESRKQTIREIFDLNHL
jgi:hypothetical protein